MQQCDQESIFIKITIYTDAVILIGMGMAVIAQNTFPFAADGKMHPMVL
jgi:hypothetical protein